MKGHISGERAPRCVSPAAPDAEQCATDHSDLIDWSPADQECVAKSLLAPPNPFSELQRAFTRRRQLLHEH
jgi:hypothetical protein